MKYEKSIVYDICILWHCGYSISHERWTADILWSENADLLIMLEHEHDIVINILTVYISGLWSERKKDVGSFVYSSVKEWDCFLASECMSLKQYLMGRMCVFT